MASLAKTNKYLATAEQRKKAVRATIATSSAIEGIFAPFTARKMLAKAEAANPKDRAKRRTA